MSFKEYGTIVHENAHPNFKEYGSLVEETPRYKSLINAPLKGAVKKSADIAELVTSIPGAKSLSKIPGPKELLGLGKDTRFIPEEGRQFAEEKFPTQERELEKYLERAGGLGVEAALSPGGIAGKVIKTGIGAGLGYASEKLGAPDWAQAIAESAPFFFSGGKKIPLKRSQKEFGEFLRKQGLSESEMAPLLKSPEQVERLSKWAAKGGKSKELMESIYQKTGHLYDTINASGKNLPPLDSQAKIKFLSEASSIIKDMPHKYRSLIKQDALDLVNSRGGLEDLTNFYRDVNLVIGAEHGGKAMVGRLKGPVMEALESISPELASDFKLTNQLYGTRSNVAGKILTKSQLDDLVDFGEMAQLGGGFVNRDLGAIAKVVGIVGARQIAREIIINPKLQNISVRIGEAIKKNKFTLAEKYTREFSKEIGKNNPEIEERINQIE